MNSADTPLKRFQEDMLALAELLRKELHEAREANSPALEGVAWQRYIKACQVAFNAYAVTLSPDSDYWEEKSASEDPPENPPGTDKDADGDLRRRLDTPTRVHASRHSPELAA